jgi:hypothetical protein
MRTPAVCDLKFHHKDEDGMFLRNDGNHQSHYAVLQSRRPEEYEESRSARSANSLGVKVKKLLISLRVCGGGGVRRFQTLSQEEPICS